MAQVFLSHSQKDQPLVGFLASVAATTNVRLVLEEYEKILAGRPA